MNDQELINEFLTESMENLAKLDQEMVELERDPRNSELLAGVFRTIHTIKGTCGFLGYDRLQSIAHVTEDILAQLRSGKRILDAVQTTLILESVDAIKRILNAIETTGGEGTPFEQDLLLRLEGTRDGKIAIALPPAEAPKPEEAAPVQEAARPEEAEKPKQPEPEATATAARVSTGGDTTLRVDVGLLDRLMNLVGELVLTRNQLAQHNAGRNDAVLNAVTQRLNLITSELQGDVMKTRMQPIGVVWNKLPRVVRDLAASLNKQIDLEMDGSETELDRTIIEAIKDPLTHIVRNSCDHGIETPDVRQSRGKKGRGRLCLRAWHEGGQVNIEIADDGGGIDPARVKAKALDRRLITEEQATRMSDREAVNLVFLPGFSTAETVTNISGRGVGMDVVRTHIERIGGAADISSKTGQGTVVRVRLPLTLAIIPGLVVRAGGERFVIPQVNLHELIQLGESGQGIEYVHETPVLRRRNSLLPLVDLCSILRMPSQRMPGVSSIVVLQADQHRFGLIVDEICDSQEIVVKPAGQQLKPLTCYAGATIMGDGRIALILDITGLATLAGVSGSAGQIARAAAVAGRVENAGPQRTLLLLFRAGAFKRLAVPLSRVARLEKISTAIVERASGRPVARYREKILPLLNLAQILDGGEQWHEEVLQVVVFRSGNSELGMVVDEITDILEEAVVDPCGSDRSALLGSAMIGGRVTDLVDLDNIAEAAAWSGAAALDKLALALSGSDASRESEEVLR